MAKKQMERVMHTRNYTAARTGGFAPAAIAAAALLFGTLFAACDTGSAGLEPPPPTIADLAGTWTNTQSTSFTTDPYHLMSFAITATGDGSITINDSLGTGTDTIDGSWSFTNNPSTSVGGNIGGRLEFSAIGTASPSTAQTGRVTILVVDPSGVSSMTLSAPSGCFNSPHASVSDSFRR